MRKASGCHPTGFSNPNDRLSIIMAKYIVIHGIRVDKEYQNFVPETFGRLTTIGPKFSLHVGKKGLRKYFQVCQCSCEARNVIVVPTTVLRGKHTNSCGCLRGDTNKNRNTVHGLAHTKEHAQWLGLLTRCYNPHCPAYPNYGGRGIGVCARWREPNGQGFINFIGDLGTRPDAGYTLDRHPNKNGNYEPGNVRWATYMEQNRNKRNNRMLTAFGKTQCMADWIDEIGISRSALANRLNKGWPIEKALSYPVRSNRGKK